MVRPTAVYRTESDPRNHVVEYAIRGSRAVVSIVSDAVSVSHSARRVFAESSDELIESCAPPKRKENIMPQTEKPAKLVPTTYRPAGAVIYPVTPRDSWVSLAWSFSIGAWDLIDFNFPGMKKVMLSDFQKATRNVNWYLAEYVGCNTPSPSGQNYVFTSGLTQGKGAWKAGNIFLPPAKPPTPPPPVPPPKPACDPIIDGIHRPDFARRLRKDEQDLVSDVFGPTLPPWNQIAITNGTGADGRAFTLNIPFYTINLGNAARQDLTSTSPASCYVNADGTLCDLLIHEMTHVWQFHHGVPVVENSILAQQYGPGYAYKAGRAWKFYNVEQQAGIVEDWHHAGRGTHHLLYPYIWGVIRTFIDTDGDFDLSRFALDLAALQKELDDFRKKAEKA
jgi:hypothetical protein